jgi:hypothetical protein
MSRSEDSVYGTGRPPNIARRHSAFRIQQSALSHDEVVEIERLGRLPSSTLMLSPTHSQRTRMYGHPAPGGFRYSVPTLAQNARMGQPRLE